MLLAHIKITKLAIITTPHESAYLLALVFPRKNISGAIFCCFVYIIYAPLTIIFQCTLLIHN